MMITDNLPYHKDDYYSTDNLPYYKDNFFPFKNIANMALLPRNSAVI
jgi:hypothetical protein